MLKADVVRAWITDFLVTFLDIDASEITGDVRFHNLGLDSVDAVVMAGAMEEHFETEIEATLVLRNSTIDELLADLKASGITS